MKNEPQEQKLLDFAKQTLDHSTQHLDTHTLSRLQAARKAALSHTSTPGASWVQPAWATAAVCLVIITMALWETDPPQLPPSLIFEDVEVVASADADGWELYEDLEFYSWLAENDQTG